MLIYYPAPTPGKYMIDQMATAELHGLLAQWGITVGSVRDDLPLYGSPQRTVGRRVIEDTERMMYVLEQIPGASVTKKERIALIVEQLVLKERSLKALPYKKNKTGNFVTFYNQAHWMLVPYIKGIPLDRSRYLDEGWRGAVMAEFLVGLHKASEVLHTDAENMELFSIKQYVEQMEGALKKNDPEHLEKLGGVFSHLKDTFLEAAIDLPVAFCHGDYHPLNIVWEEKGIAGVIDWEFCGIKTELYDVANMVGCLGMEHPSTLRKDIVTGFIHTLRKEKIYSKKSWKWFLPLVISIRLGWLSEWLRSGDESMVDLESTYMNLLLEKRKLLCKIWDIDC